MKIVYLAPSIIPSRSANSIHVMKMCQAFAKNGHEVTLIVPNRKDEVEPGVKDVYEFYGVERCFRIERVRWYRVKGQDQLYGLMSALKARNIKPDLVYSRIIGGACFAAWLGLPVVFEAHTPSAYGGNASIYLFKSLSHSAKLIKIVAISCALKDYLEKNYPHLTAKLQIAHDGADPIENNNSLNIISKDIKTFSAGYFGHLYKGKGIELIIKLADICNWVDFHIIGGRLSDVNYWKQKSANTNIIYHGFIPHKDAVKLFEPFSVLLAPYQEEVSSISGTNIVNWMSPLKIFEYMAAGKPIICSDLPVLREVLIDGYNSILCPHDNAQAWADSIKKLRDNPKLGTMLGNNARADFLKNYTWSSRAEKVLRGLNDQLAH